LSQGKTGTHPRINCGTGVFQIMLYACSDKCARQAEYLFNRLLESAFLTPRFWLDKAG